MRDLQSEKKKCGDLDLPIARCSYLQSLPCCCSHGWGGAMPQLSFGLYQLTGELKLLTKSK